MSDEAERHLGNVLNVLADLHPDDRCRAFEEAMTFYNERHPEARVQGMEGWVSHLVIDGPLQRLEREHDDLPARLLAAERRCVNAEFAGLMREAAARINGKKVK